MSIHHLSLAAELDMPAAKKLIFMAACDDADRETGEGFPGIDKLKKWAGLRSKSRVLELINELIADGYLARVEAGRKGTRAVFRVFDKIACCPLHDPKTIGSAVPDPNPSGSDEPDPIDAIGSGIGSDSYRTPPLSPLKTKELNVEPVGPTPIKAKNVDRPELHNLCAHLANRMIENGCKPPTITDAWLTSARLMIDTDGREVAAIHKCIDWCQDNEFWRGNILSMPKLRAKYDQLRLAAIKEAKQEQAKKPILAVVRNLQPVEVAREDLPWIAESQS